MVTGRITKYVTREVQFLGLIPIFTFSKRESGPSSCSGMCETEIADPRGRRRPAARIHEEHEPGRLTFRSQHFNVIKEDYDPGQPSMPLLPSVKGYNVQGVPSG